MNECLSLEHVGKTYEGFALRDVSFTLPSGCLMGFIGENGAGKTTTIKLILDLVARESGSIRLFGKDLREGGADLTPQTGAVFDECPIPPILSPADAGRIWARLYPEWDDGRFRQYLSRWRIPEHKKVRELSRGMKMKLSIALALAHRPRLLILDEATSGLDPIVRDEILDEFQRFLEEEGRAILLSTHITSDLDRVADYITFIHQGRVVFSESKDVLLETYGIVRCSETEAARIPREIAVGIRRGAYSCDVLVSDAAAARRVCPGAVIDRPDLEQIMLLQIKGEPSR